MTSKFLPIFFTILSIVIALASSGCLVRRTVSEGGEVISSGYVVETPILDALRGESGN